MRILIFILLVSSTLLSQNEFNWNHPFTEADTLRGSLRPERTAFDVTFYEVTVRLDIDNKMIEGEVWMEFDNLAKAKKYQIDLFENMVIDDINYLGKSLNYERIANAVFIDVPDFKIGEKGGFRITYHGKPIIAHRAPWDGGFVWKEDSNGVPWIGVACEGIGASLWWPNKDHLSDEPDSLRFHIEVPDSLFAAANGNLIAETKLPDNYKRYSWKVNYPINNYNLSLNVGDYRHFSDVYLSKDGDTLQLDYYVLAENLAKAKTHFEQVKPMLACFEEYVGKYPFWEDGFALIETPYLGMEHQSGIAYGNGYQRGYLGGMIPKDMDWDYIIIHEAGHEYFGNSVSCGDLAEMWIHESFTTYLEAVYVECRYGYEDAVRYLKGQRPYIQNTQPIIGPYDVNWEHWTSSDHYYKGSWMLHTLRHAINDDNVWWKLFKDFYQNHKRQIADTEDFITTVNEATGKDWSGFFDQYLHHPQIPTLVLEPAGRKTWKAKWEAVAGFEMPISFEVDNKVYHSTIEADEWTKLPFKSKKLPKVNKDLYLIH